MLQAIGLTSTSRRDLPPAVDDLTFEARAGHVTALLGADGAGKTTTLRLMLELESGRGITYFRGRPLHRIAHPAREVGVLLGDVPGHPARTTKGQLRMLCAAAGLPASRADALLDLVGIGALRDEPLGTLSLGMDRRLGLAAALLGDPHTLVLDEPAAASPPREELAARAAPGARGPRRHRPLRHRRSQGGGPYRRSRRHPPRGPPRRRPGRRRLRADPAAPARRHPHPARGAPRRSRQPRGPRGPPFRRGRHRRGRTADRLRQQLRRVGRDRLPARHPRPPTRRRDRRHRPESGRASGAPARPASASEAPPPPAGPRNGLPPPPLAARPVRSPLRPFRYELRRFLGVRTPWLVTAAVLVASVALTLPLARTGTTPLPGLLAARPDFLPLPPAALGAGLLGAFAFGDEYRYPALAAGRGTVPRRLGLLLAKLTVTGTAALLLAALTVVVASQSMRLVYGAGTDVLPPDWPALAVSWAGLTVGCAWAGLLGAGIFRVTGAGVAAVLAVPVVVVPLVRKGLAVPSARSIAGLPARLRELAWPRWPEAADRWLVATGHVLAQPVAAALTLSLTGLLCAYLFTSLRRRARW